VCVCVCVFVCVYFKLDGKPNLFSNGLSFICYLVRHYEFFNNNQLRFV
jgi:Ca2+/H+ antiporter